MADVPQVQIQLLRLVSIFAPLPAPELESLARALEPRHVAKGTTVVREGEAGREFFILLDGSAEVTRKGKLLASHHGGAFFGEIALMCDVPRVATVTPTSATRALVITDRDFRSLVKRTPEIALKVLEAVGKRLPADDA